MPVNSETRKNGSEPTVSEVRGAIEHGQTQDKVAGFDPAASPMETDGEAGGARPVASREAPVKTGSPLPTPNATAHGDAMRPFEDAAQPTIRKSLFGYIGVIVLIAIVLIAGVMIWS